MEQRQLKKDLTLKVLLIVLLVTFISLLSFAVWSSLRPIAIYKGYTVTLQPGQTIHIGEPVPYIASGEKLVMLDGIVTRYISCRGQGEDSDTIIRVGTTPTNSIFGKYKLKNQSLTGGAANFPQLKLPATCFLRNSVTFKPAPLHPDVSYTAISQYNGNLSTFQLVK